MMAHFSKQKALLTGAVGVLVIAGVIALSVNDSHHPRLTPASKSHPLVNGHPAASSRTTTSLSSTGTSSPTSASTVPDAASGTDWVVSGSDTLYLATNGVTYHEVNPPLPKGTQLVSAVVSGSTVITYDYNPQQLPPGQPLDLDLSHNGGVTWSVEQVNAYGDPTNVHFVVAHGSVIGMMVDTLAPGANSTGGEWFQTNNDGETWTNPFLNASPSNAPQGGPVTLVGSDLWVLGGGQGYDQLWLSTNNGASWSQVHFPGESLDDIPSHGCQDIVYPSIAGQLSSGATVLVTAKVPNGNCTSNYLDVTAYASTNQGATWTAFGSVTTTQVSVHSGLLPKYVTVQGNSVWLATVPNQFVINPPPSPPQFVRITTNGAHSLVSLPIAPTSDGGAESITVNPNDQLQVTLVHIPPINERAPTVISRRYISINDGETWKPLAMHFLANGSPVAKKS
ncbi:sialidase family protein [Ferrimicrobium sp.]|uniref:sialidase family protein n=1 Tax=Ferrimicrobium sp. TaxID=2926050 RepID=UPI002613178B|nr:sialidase family protein [Ferrimicrobium sp.]